MGRHIRQYVKNELFDGQQLPPPTNRRFHPKLVDLRNHMYLATTENRFSKFDQENIDGKIREWQKEDSDDKFFFRPYTESGELSSMDMSPHTTDESDIENPDTSPVIKKKSLLFVHQTAWQKRLLARYGNDMCLFDATYKTTRLAVPLFFLVVKTNADYQVVGSIVTQGESTEDIMEGLQVLVNWNPNWKPSYFMTDYSEAEINAIEKIFISKLYTRIKFASAVEPG